LHKSEEPAYHKVADGSDFFTTAADLETVRQAEAYDSSTPHEAEVSEKSRLTRTGGCLLHLPHESGSTSGDTYSIGCAAEFHFINR
jgi:hypothetical protein